MAIDEAIQPRQAKDARKIASIGAADVFSQSIVSCGFSERTIVPWFNELESSSFYAQLNLASGWDVAQHILQENPSVRALSNACKEHRSFVARLWERIVFLADSPIDEKFSSPWDSAICAYLFVLARAAPMIAPAIAIRALRAPNLWWAAQLANRLSVGASVQFPGALRVAAPTRLPSQWASTSSEQVNAPVLSSSFPSTNAAELKMIQHAWSVLCLNFIANKYSNNISLIEIIEQLNVPSEPAKSGEQLIMPVNFMLASLWFRGDDDGDSTTVRVFFVTPDGMRSQPQEQSISFGGQKRVRVFTPIAAVPVMSNGLYLLAIEQKSGSDWLQVGQTPLEVTFSPPQVPSPGTTPDP